MSLMPGLIPHFDNRFTDSAGQVVLFLGFFLLQDHVYVFAECTIEGKFFTLPLDRWNELYVATTSKAYEDMVAKRISENNKT